MVANHAGVRWLSADEGGRGLNGALIFAGSLAPVLFFTVTGIGRGVQAASGANRSLWGVLARVAVLFLADAALWLSPATHVGMDFLGFIGLSTLLVEVVNRARRPNAWAAALLGACLIIRFGIGPRLGLSAGHGATNDLLRYLVGDSSLPGFSYAPMPWLAYPLFGLLVGRLAAANAARLRAARAAWAGALAAGALLGFAACLVLARRGMIFFRWGSLSFAYFVFGFAALLGAFALVLAAVRGLPPRAVKTISLPGMASFILVPVHYVLVALLARVLPPESAPRVFLLAVPFVIVAVLALSKIVDRPFPPPR